MSSDTGRLLTSGYKKAKGKKRGVEIPVSPCSLVPQHPGSIAARHSSSPNRLLCVVKITACHFSFDCCLATGPAQIDCYVNEDECSSLHIIVPLTAASLQIQPEWIAMFNEEELQTLISGRMEEGLDLEDLRAHTGYAGGRSCAFCQARHIVRPPCSSNVQ
eukprot:scaffold139294_cov17-Tisochrysis_lutea.AAC.1